VEVPADRCGFLRRNGHSNKQCTISYAVAYIESSFIELTSYYANTDIIRIKIADNGEPLESMPVVLVHTLRYGSNGYDVQLPGEGYAFHTDANGAIILHLGRLAYTAAFGKTDQYYLIYVNGQNTGHSVTSTGTGLTQLVEIDLAGQR
jgi:hypothetical protein